MTKTFKNMSCHELHTHPNLIYEDTDSLKRFHGLISSKLMEDPKIHIGGTAIPNIVPDIPNIHKILTNMGHGFVHQSGLDESSGQKPTIVLHRIAFRVYLMFSRIGKNTKY